MKKVIIASLVVLGIVGCSSKSTWEQDYLKYQRNGAGYCGNHEVSKYVDMGNTVIVVCSNGKTTLVQDDGTFLGK